MDSVVEMKLELGLWNFMWWRTLELNSDPKTLQREVPTGKELTWPHKSPSIFCSRTEGGRRYWRVEERGWVGRGFGDECLQHALVRPNPCFESEESLVPEQRSHLVETLAHDGVEDESSDTFSSDEVFENLTLAVTDLEHPEVDLSVQALEYFGLEDQTGVEIQGRPSEPDITAGNLAYEVFVVDTESRPEMGACHPPTCVLFSACGIMDKDGAALECLAGDGSTPRKSSGKWRRTELFPLAKIRRLIRGDRTRIATVEAERLGNDATAAIQEIVQPQISIRLLSHPLRQLAAPPPSWSEFPEPIVLKISGFQASSQYMHRILDTVGLSRDVDGAAVGDLPEVVDSTFSTMPEGADDTAGTTPEEVHDMAIDPISSGMSEDITYTECDVDSTDISREEEEEEEEEEEKKKLVRRLGWTLDVASDVAITVEEEFDGAGKTGDISLEEEIDGVKPLAENPLTYSIVRHDSHLRKSGVNQPVVELTSPWWEACIPYAQPPRPRPIGVLLLTAETGSHFALPKADCYHGYGGRNPICWSMLPGRRMDVFRPELDSSAAVNMEAVYNTLPRGLFPDRRGDPAHAVTTTIAAGEFVFGPLESEFSCSHYLRLNPRLPSVPSFSPLRVPNGTHVRKRTVSMLQQFQIKVARRCSGAGTTCRWYHVVQNRLDANTVLFEGGKDVVVAHSEPPRRCWEQYLLHAQLIAYSLTDFVQHDAVQPLPIRECGISLERHSCSCRWRRYLVLAAVGQLWRKGYTMASHAVGNAIDTADELLFHYLQLSHTRGSCLYIPQTCTQTMLIGNAKAQC
ncbi:hypothetical protein PR048_023252 [Dryococelus australis]|uniref:Uncharacterized protein n=1 Tax=Dryococelus australis TaxID=614101 RepID=A0ABQ9GTK1_9NEOP|nr:hypothetical protein PR048_023252 [Dryococelus australis]